MLDAGSASHLNILMDLAVMMLFQPSTINALDRLYFNVSTFAGRVIILLLENRWAMKQIKLLMNHSISCFKSTDIVRLPPLSEQIF